MDVHSLYMLIKEHGTITMAAAALIMTIIQITPIKVNPWTRLARGIAKLFTGDVTKKLDTLEKKLDTVDQRLNAHIEESDARDLRKRRESILDFASAIAEGKRSYTKEQYEQMLSECDSYYTYCEEKRFKNAVAEESIALIRRSYAKRLVENNFLTMKGV